MEPARRTRRRWQRKTVRGAARWWRALPCSLRCRRRPRNSGGALTWFPAGRISLHRAAIALHPGTTRLNDFGDLGALSALLSVVIIDVVLAGDNAIVVGMAAAGLPAERRRRVIALGILAATVLRILFAFVAVELLNSIIGLTVAGGLLLLWVAWKMYREIRSARPTAAHAHAPVAQPLP